MKNRNKFEQVRAKKFHERNKKAKELDEINKEMKKARKELRSWRVRELIIERNKLR